MAGTLRPTRTWSPWHRRSHFPRCSRTCWSPTRSSSTTKRSTESRTGPPAAAEGVAAPTLAGLVRAVGQRAAVRGRRRDHRGNAPRRARTTRLLLGGLRRWGYVSVTPPAGEALRNPPQDRDRDPHHVRRSAGTRRLASLGAVIDGRWRSRFGFQEVWQLERALRAVFDELPFDPPAYLPVVYPTQGGRTEPPFPAGPGRRASGLTPGPICRDSSRGSSSHSPSTSRRKRGSLSPSVPTRCVCSTRRHPVRDLPRLTGCRRRPTRCARGGWNDAACAVTRPDPTAKRGQVAPPHPEGTPGATGVPATSRGHRGVMANSVRRPRRCRTPGGARAPRGGRHPGLVPAGPGLEPHPDNWRAKCGNARDVAALPDGPAPRRLSRWQLRARTPSRRMWQA